MIRYLALLLALACWTPSAFAQTLPVPSAGGGSGGAGSGTVAGSTGNIGRFSNGTTIGNSGCTSDGVGGLTCSGSTISFQGASHTLPITSGSSLPATCTFTAGSAMEVFLKTDATAGQNLYFCTATNTWTQQTGGAGTPAGSNTQVQFNNSGAFGANSALTFDGTVLHSTALSAGTNPATAGGLRLPNTSIIQWRNAANSANVQGITLDSSNRLNLLPPAFFPGQTTGVAVNDILAYRSVPTGTGMTTGYISELHAIDITATDIAVGQGVQQSSLAMNTGPGAVNLSTWPLTLTNTILGTGNAAAEHNLLVGGLVSQIGTGYTQTAGPSGRDWATDFGVHGPIAVQPQLLSGHTLIMNNYYNGSPVDSPSYGLGLVTRQGFGTNIDPTHAAANTFPLDTAITIGGVSSGGANGFNTALTIGGAVQTAWGVTSSLFTTIGAFRDYTADGLTFKRNTDSSPTAFALRGIANGSTSTTWSVADTGAATFAGITSTGSGGGAIDFAGSTSGLTTLQGPAVGTSGVSTLPAGTGTLLSTAAVVTVPQGGTGIASGTSGGVPYFSSTTTIASSGALTVNVLTKGGGAGAAPTNSLATDDGTTLTYAGTGGGSFVKLATTGTAGPLVGVESAAPAALASNGKLWFDSTDHRLHDINPSGTIGTTVVANAGASNEFLTSISVAGIVARARPSSSNLSDAANIPLLDAANTFSSATGQSMKKLLLPGSSSGTLTVLAAAAAGTSTLTLPGGTTDFSATGGTSQVVKQTSAGAALTVGQLGFSDISGTAGVAQGGTNIASYTVGDLIYASGATTLATRAAVASGQVLASAGTGTAPAYTGSPTLSGTLTAATLATNGTAGNITGPKITASGTAPGAGFAKFEIVAGGTGTTCKLIMYAGTSSTATDVIDNVGSGC